jgi:putative component of membrane protein insertase Oxa1/YidC/SpoIIIJ protein YidD
MESIAHFGVVKGGLKAAWRLARCHPFAKGGFDPVTSYQSPVASHQSPGGTEGSPELGTGHWPLATSPKESTS